MSNENIIIFGCGISGSVCALKLLKEGFDVTIIEKSSEVGGHTQTKIDITEDIHINPIIDELGLSFLDRSNESIWFTENKTFSFKSEVSDLFVKRGPEEDSFDVRTAQAIKNSGGRIKTGCTTKGFEKKKGKIKSTKVSTNEGIKELEADFFVDATGGDSKLLKRTSLNNFTKRGDEIIGYGFICRNLDMPQSKTHVFFDSKLIPGGYFFAAKTKEGLSVASIVSTKEKISKPIDQYFKRFVKEKKELSNIVKNCKPINYFRGSRTTGILDQRVKKNFCLVGDSAYTLDPLFGYGVRPAILSGYLAAKKVKKSYERNESNLLDYEKALENTIVSKTNEMFLLRKIFDEMNNTDLDFILESLIELDKNHSLDNVFNEPEKYYSSLLKLVLKNPFQSTRLGYKTIKNIATSP